MVVANSSVLSVDEAVLPRQVQTTAETYEAKVRVNVDPDRKSRGYATVKVLKGRGGSFVPVRTVRTERANDVAVVNVPRGRYVVKIPAQHGFATTTSGQVIVRR